MPLIIPSSKYVAEKLGVSRFRCFISNPPSVRGEPVSKYLHMGWIRWLEGKSDEAQTTRIFLKAALLLYTEPEIARRNEIKIGSGISRIRIVLTVATDIRPLFSIRIPNRLENLWSFFPFSLVARVGIDSLKDKIYLSLLLMQCSLKKKSRNTLLVHSCFHYQLILIGGRL